MKRVFIQSMFLLSFMLFCTLQLPRAEGIRDTIYEEETLVTPSNSVPCPKCGSPENVIPIVYGYPSQGLMDRADQGKVKLGGCVIGGNDPHYYCKKCEQSW